MSIAKVIPQLTHFTLDHCTGLNADGMRPLTDALSKSQLVSLCILCEGHVLSRWKAWPDTLRKIHLSYCDSNPRRGLYTS